MVLCKNEVFFLFSTKNAVFRLLLVSSYFSLKFWNKYFTPYGTFHWTDEMLKRFSGARSSFYFFTFLWIDAITGITLAAERPLCTGRSGVNLMHGPLEGTAVREDQGPC